MIQLIAVLLRLLMGISFLKLFLKRVLKREHFEKNVFTISHSHYVREMAKRKEAEMHSILTVCQMLCGLFL